MSEKGVPWWVKTVMYVALPIGVLILAYKVITDWLLGPLNAVKELWKEQYEDWVSELAQFTHEDNGNLTAEHQTILDQKNKVMQQTEATYVQTVGSTYGLIEYCFTVAVAGAAFYGIAKTIIDKYSSRTKGQVQTTKGESYVMVCMLAEDLADKGYPTQASALVTTMEERFNSVDAPYMNTQISLYQSQLPNLTGWELLYANYMITAYQTELVAIPIWFTYLPPMLRGAIRA